MSSNFFGIKHIVLLWLVCFVIELETAAHQKRDVHHMIVLKSNSRHRSKPHHDARSGRRLKRGKKQHNRHRHREEDLEDSEEREEREGDNRSQEREQSFEDFFKGKKSKSHRQQYKTGHHKDLRDNKPLGLGPPIYVTSPDGSDEYNDEIQYESQWKPLTSPAIQEPRPESRPKKKENHHSSQRSKTNKSNNKKRKQKRKNSVTEPFFIEITTERSLKQSDNEYTFESSNYPPIPISSSFSQFDLSKTGRESHRAAPLIGTIEQHKKADFSEEDQEHSDFFASNSDHHGKQEGTEIVTAKSTFFGDYHLSGTNLLAGEVDLVQKEKEDFSTYGRKKEKKKFSF